MKKKLYVFLVACLILGLWLSILDQRIKKQDGFMFPSRFTSVLVDLNQHPRMDEVVLSRELTVPTTVELMFQSDTANLKHVKVVSEGQILGKKSNEVNFIVGQFMGTASVSATMIMTPGKYNICLTSDQVKGLLIINYQETAIETAEFERLYRIHNGELNNPPEGYVQVFATELAGLEYKDEVIYSITIDQPKLLGLSVYTSAQQGDVSVDFIGENTEYIGLVSADYSRICDQLEVVLPRGKYQLKLSSSNADGQLYVFIKQ